MSDLFGNHIVGFPTRWLMYISLLSIILYCTYTFIAVGDSGLFERQLGVIGSVNAGHGVLCSYLEVL